MPELLHFVMPKLERVKVIQGNRYKRTPPPPPSSLNLVLFDGISPLALVAQWVAAKPGCGQDDGCASSVVGGKAKFLPADLPMSAHWERTKESTDAHCQSSQIPGNCKKPAQPPGEMMYHQLGP